MLEKILNACSCKDRMRPLKSSWKLIPSVKVYNGIWKNSLKESSASQVHVFTKHPKGIIGITGVVISENPARTHLASQPYTCSGRSCAGISGGGSAGAGRGGIAGTSTSQTWHPEASNFKDKTSMYLIRIKNEVLFIALRN